MMPFWLQTAGAWVWDASWHAAVVVGVVLIVRQIAGKRLPPALRCALWTLVALRLVLVSAPQGSWSLFGLLEKVKWPHSAKPVAESIANDDEPGDGPKITVGYGPAPIKNDTAPIQLPKTPGTSAANQIALSIWMAGAFFFLMRSALSRIRLARQLRGSLTVDDPHVLALLHRCSAEMKIRQPVRICITEAVAGPALTGVRRPVILLPPGIFSRLSPQQLRFVFLHELAHVRRHDVLIEWFIALLSAVHWFNPAVWLAAYLYRADRELCRDEMVLRAASAGDRAGYGHTLLALLEFLAPSRPAPAFAVAMLGGKARLKQRISMIANLRSTPARLMLVALLIAFAIMSWMVLTNPRRVASSNATSQPAPASPPANTNAGATTSTADDKNKNLQLLLERRLPQIDFGGQGLSDVIDFLQDVARVNIVVNWNAVQAAGVGKSTPVTARLRDVSLAKALNTILADAAGGKAQLAFKAEGGVIVISTIDDLPGNLAVRVYDIRDLIVIPPDFAPDKDHPVGAKKAATRPAEAPMSQAQLAQGLAKLIRETIDPESWLPPRQGTLKEDNGQLIIRQTLEAHEEIGRLLNQLRETRGLQITTTARFVVFDPSILPQNDPAWTPFRSIPENDGNKSATKPTIVASNFLSADQTTALLKIIAGQEGASTRAAPKLTSFNGQRAYVTVATQRAYVADLKIIRDEQGKTKSYEPVIDTATSGLTLDLQGTISADRKYATLTIRPTLTKLLQLHTVPFSNIPKDHPANLEKPSIQAPEMYSSEARMTVSVPDNQTLVIGMGDDVGLLLPDNEKFKARPGNKLYVLVTPKLIIPHEK